MSQKGKRKGVTKELLLPQEGKKGYAAYEVGLEVRGGPKTVLIDGEELHLRKYHLKRKQLERALAEWHATGRFRSPYVKSVLSDFLNALAGLGLNRHWEDGEVVNAMRALMNVPSRVRGGLTDWERFSKKPKRTANGKTMEGRIETMVRSLRKTNASGALFPMGRKLEQMGCCVDMFFFEEEVPGEHGPEKMVRRFYRLNTHSTRPLCMRIQAMDEVPPVNVSHKSLGPE
jgi:hypothetical protein